MIRQYIDIFVDEVIPEFIDKYLTTKTLKRLKHITQFCGCDYTKLYSPLFLYTRFDHSLVVAHMTWHFTHDKKETIIALLHDIGTPCFAHCIDYVFEDYINQESSEKNIVDMIKKDKKLLGYLAEDNLTLEDFNNYPNCHILENKAPRLCTDRLDGVLHTCYVWIHTHSLEQIKEVYDDMIVLKNEGGEPEIGFKNVDIAEKFVSMVCNYAKELQGNEDKFVSKYISEVVKLTFEKKLISLEDLYIKKEKDLCDIFAKNVLSWNVFKNANNLIRTNNMPKNKFYISYETKRRNAIPLVHTFNGDIRVDKLSNWAKKKYQELDEYKDSKYAYIDEIEDLDRTSTD